ncbi:trichohyalin, putative [Entamoeba histolytica]
MEGMNTKEIIKQIEELTEKRINNIIFDSDKDDWNKNTSVFDQRIWNKEYVIIIIEDSEGNKFGGYVNSKIDKIGTGECINDSKSFVFSLESNGRIEGMKKFDIKKSTIDIAVFKENDKTKSYCCQYSFEYEGIKSALCGKEYPNNYFTPKRIIVIEMK